MHARVPSSRIGQVICLGFLLALLPLPGITLAQTDQVCNPVCIAPDRGDGTIDLPAPCPYTSPDGDMIITGGLPPTASIVIDPTLDNYINVVVSPGGTLGGEIVEFDGVLACPMFGTGGLAGFSRSINIPVHVEVHTAPRNPGDAVQSFQSDMIFIEGQIFGDPDFELLKVSGGSANGLPSPGHTTLSELPSGNFNVDSFFDIEYRIEFQGAPGSILDGMGGVTDGGVRMEQGEHFWTPEDGHKMHYPQLPDLSGWDVNTNAPLVVADDWQCSESGPVKDIHFWGSWAGGVEGGINSFEVGIYSDIPEGDTIPYSRPGELLWRRTISNFCTLPVQVPNGGGWYDQVSGGVFPGDHIRIFQYDIQLDSIDWFVQEQGTIYWLAISANVQDPAQTLWGWHSSIEHFNDDAAWSSLSPQCVAPDNGTGTVNLPPQDCPYGSDGTVNIVNGLPPNTTIESTPLMFDYNNIQSGPGGTLGGEIITFDAILELTMTGTGDLAGFNRFIPMPVNVEIHTGPRTPGDPVQDFQCEMVLLQGQLFGDPDFDQLGIQAGSSVGLPSPGQTTLTQIRAGNWNVDSFFDIEYEIQFQGAPGSVLDGMSGVTTEILEMHLGGPPLNPWLELYEPPTFAQSMDMAFVITAGVADQAPCECTPGDADGNGTLAITDAVYIVNFIFGGGPTPTPFPVCSGDADCNCQVAITDAVYIINYIFGGGPAPCDCETWRANCGSP